MENTEQIRADRQRIEELGGPTKTAELLGYDKTKGGVQRVQNWMTRGIPARVRVAHPGLFMLGLVTAVAAGDIGPPEQGSAGPGLGKRR